MKTQGPPHSVGVQHVEPHQAGGFFKPRFSVIGAMIAAGLLAPALVVGVSFGAGLKTEFSTISGTVFYEGRSEGPVRVEAFDRPQFAPRPAYSTRISGPGPYEVKIRPGAYYLRAFVDRNENGNWDEGEPIGVYQAGAALVIPPLAFKNGIDIRIDPEQRSESLQKKDE